jgi:hypothetical protein
VKHPALVKWRKRAKTAEARVQALEELILAKTGMTSTEHFLYDFTKLQCESPRMSVRFTNLQTPAEELRAKDLTSMRQSSQ